MRKSWEALSVILIDLKCPDSSVDDVEDFSYLALQMQAVFTHLCSYNVLTFAKQPGYLRHFMYFAILKYICVFHRMWMRKLRLRGLKPAVGKPVRV